MPAVVRTGCGLIQLRSCGIADGHRSTIHSLLAEWERDTGDAVPRRATIYDVGTELSHKRIICFKRYAEGKSANRIARETHQGLEPVDRYLGQYDRVRHRRLQGSPPAETAHASGCALRLV